MEWLSGLEEIRANFKYLIIKIHVGSRYNNLKREAELHRSPTSLKSIMKAMQD